MELLDLYKEENKNLLYAISWLNKNSLFDKSIGKFREIDLFTFLEKINQFNYNEDLYFDDFYYILEYTENSILHLINNLNKEIKRAHKVIPISEAKELDNKSVLWISKQNGRNIREKLSKGKVKAVKRYEKLDTYENRVFKFFLKKILEVYENRDDIQYKFENLFIKIRRFLKSDNAKEINEYGKIIYNNILLHHPHYNKIFKSYKKIFNLNEIYDIYLNSFESIIKTIIKFETLSQFQFTTKVPILAKNLEIHRAKYQINLQNPLIQLYPLYLEKVIESVYESLNGYNLNLIRNKITEIINKELNFIYFRSRRSKQRIPKDISFKINIKNDDEIFIDIFQLFPIANINDEIIKFPIVLKQKIDNKLINANNTKIIDLNYDFYSLSEILETFDKNIFKYFLDYFSSIFLNNKLYYVIPDFVNIFEFSEFKKMINLYFKQNNAIPKSILAGFQYIYNKQPKKDKVLFYIQKNIKNDLYVTPLLIKYDEKLKNISKGFFLERYPTKKVENLELDNSFNELFDEEDLEIISNKFKEDELKNIKEKNICFYKNKDIITLKDIKFTSIKFNNLKKIKKLYPLLKDKESIIIDYDSEAILSNFQKIVNYEKKGYILWKEHLPNLSIEVQLNGWWKEFILVNEKSKLINKNIEINNNFLIPEGVKELSFPLIFGDEKINYKIYLSSKEFPYSKDVECKLNLTYDYERENSYELIFEPLNKKYQNIKCEWRKVANKNILPIPNYPEKKSWKDFEEFKSKKQEKTNLFEWISKSFEIIIEIAKFCEGNSDKFFYKENINFGWFQDRRGFYFSKIFLDDIGEIFFHQNNFEKFDKSINSATFEIRNNKMGGFEAINIIEGKKISNRIFEFIRKSYRFPLKTIWNNGNSLSDKDVPIEFKEIANEAINSALLIYQKTQNKNLKKEMFHFLSCLHSDTPQEIIEELKLYADEFSNFKKNMDEISYAIGDMKLKWQKELLIMIIKFLKSDNEKEYSTALKILGVAFWRSEKLLLQIPENIILIISQKLYKSFEIKIKNEKIYYFDKKLNYNIIKFSIVKRLELLLAILRYREKNKEFLSPLDELTKKYIKLIDLLVEVVLNNKLKLKSTINLEIKNSNCSNNIPNLLYVLRAYLTGNKEITQSIKVLEIENE